MNFALIVDKCKVESYIVRDKKAYKLSNPELPYQFHHSVGNECFIGFWGYPFVFGGHFINWSEWNTLPDLNLDLIFVAMFHETAPNIFIDNETYIACKHDFSDLREKIDMILGNYQNYQYIIDNARKKIEQVMHPHTVAMHIYNIFKEVI